MGSPLGAANYNSLLQGAASLERLGTTGVRWQVQIVTVLTQILAPYKRPPKINALGQTNDWVDFQKTPVAL